MKSYRGYQLDSCWRRSSNLWLLQLLLPSCCLVTWPVGATNPSHCSLACRRSKIFPWFGISDSLPCSRIFFWNLNLFFSADQTRAFFWSDCLIRGAFHSLCSRRTAKEVLMVIGFSMAFAVNIGLNNFSLSLLAISVNVIIRACLPLATEPWSWNCVVEMLPFDGKLWIKTIRQVWQV